MYLGSDIGDVVVDRPVLRDRRPRGPAGDAARRLEHRGNADELQEAPSGAEGGQGREHLEGEADVVRGVGKQPPRLRFVRKTILIVFVVSSIDR